ncbi:HAUS augmin-like complex subunit 6 isoform X2 [Octopus sinensis]|uniref:HAUS augmin-like complex subunit 6 isoform X2 n=1 Tax=Octopus sinensis TaxID=2607531 RepID=A0A7E6EPR8_9MOLL|nr:HAUS augmin-like complex subunit 6 isoform X2 [Octopus sinensis]
MSSKTKTAPDLLRNGPTAEPSAIKKLRVNEQQQRLRQSFFTNILLLGFDREAQEKKDHLQYNENMFAVPNNKGALPILYFLMEKLDPEEAKTRFRGFWPVFDKKQEQYFRKELCNWLNKIAQEDPEAGFNSVFPSLFLSPGGYKFEQFLFYLSRYVLLKTLKKECNIKDGYLRCPTLKPSLPQAAHIPKILKCATIKNVQSLLVSIDENLKLYWKWQEATKKLTEEYKIQFKKINRMNSSLKDALKENNTKENCDGTDESRNEVLYWIKHQWKDILHQIQSQNADRETIQSVIKSFESKHKLDMQLINACIPDQLLQVKEKEIQEEKVESLYKRGKLDIVSLIKLSNFSLQMYHEKLQSVNVSDCKETISEFETLSKNHSKYLENIESMRQEITDVLEESKDSVHYLTEKLSDNCDKVDAKTLVMIPHSPPPENFLLMPGKKEHLSQSGKSILDSTTILNSEEEAKKILEAATIAVQNCTEQKPINLIDTVKKNSMLSEDLITLKATKQNTKHTKPSLKLSDPTSSQFSLDAHCSINQTNKDVNKKNTDNTKASSLRRPTRIKVPAKLSHEKAMKDYVSSVVDCYKTGGNADLQDVTEALSMDAFQSKDKLARSPVKPPKHQKLMLPKVSLPGSVETTPTCSEQRSFRLSLSDKPLEDESDSILVD